GLPNSVTTAHGVIYSTDSCKDQPRKVVGILSTPRVDLRFALLYQGFVWRIKLRKLSKLLKIEIAFKLMIK
ncbi:hypothetical protein, partial [Paenibacillus sp. N3.4]|uniref:hypothetical protein n=1 Tax=Paenibacillus sp. N3.4 TaxID=2603222 RepID=UPI001C9C9191